MRTLFNDVAVAHNEDDIALFDRRQAVGDNKARPAAHHLGKRLLNAYLGEGVDRGSRLVQNQNARVGQHRARYAQKLPLTEAEVVALLADHRVVALRHTADKAVRVGGFCRFDHLFIGRVLGAVAQVFHDCAIEQPALLKHHSKAFSQLIALHCRNINAVKVNAAAVQLVKPHKQVYQRGLSAARGADYRNVAAALDIERKVLYQRLVGRIRKADVVYFDVAPAGLGSFF